LDCLILNPDSLDALRQKKEAVRDTLVTTLLLPQKRATVPSLEMAQALETLSRRPGPDRYIASLARFMIGCSGRLSDIQHTQPSAKHLTNNTIEYVAWQTKVLSVTQNRQKPTPLTSQLLSFTGICTDWLFSVFSKTIITQICTDRLFSVFSKAIVIQSVIYGRRSFPGYPGNTGATMRMHAACFEMHGRPLLLWRHCFSLSPKD
jgi:hypothetical protein